MRFLKSILAGVAALLCSVIAFAVVFVSPDVEGVAVLSWYIRHSPAYWIAGLLLFQAGFWWEFRRASR